ncbi:MAG: hypothetical protein IPK22_20865 [Verrucomicrobiaceae bacterium]|nr:hypothetical protein [Verrucomicrobiaceae bacterium]
MTTDDLTLMLSEWILDPFSIVDRGEMELLASPDGSVIQARDAYLSRYQSRLDSVRKLCASDTDLICQHQRTVDILEGLDSVESLELFK